METVFKEGDKVYCFVNGHGIIKEIKCKADYPVYVEFTNDDSDQYTYDGRLYMDSLPTLSFTEYTLQGFSQERQIELPEVGELCLVRDYNDDTWLAREFAEYRHGLFICQAVHGQGEVEWKYMKRIKILD